MKNQDDSNQKGITTFPQEALEEILNTMFNPHRNTEVVNDLSANGYTTIGICCDDNGTFHAHTSAELFKDPDEPLQDPDVCLECASKLAEEEAKVEANQPIGTGLEKWFTF